MQDSVLAEAENVNAVKEKWHSTLTLIVPQLQNKICYEATQ